MKSSATAGTAPASTRSRPLTIAVFGHYGNENLGDEAIIEASIHNIRNRLPTARIVCFSLRPMDTQARYGVQSYSIREGVDGGVSRREEMEEERRSQVSLGVQSTMPTAAPTGLKGTLKRVPVLYDLARFLVLLPRSIQRLGRKIGFYRRSRTILKSIDLLFIAGSNQFLDNFGGTWGFPYRMLKWTLLAKSAGTKVAYVSVGAGPFAARLSKMMCRAALALADYQSLRDEQSKALLLGARHSYLPLVSPDLAFSLPASANEPESKRFRGDGSKPTIGINLMAIYNDRYWHAPDREKYERYVRQVAEFAAFVVREGYPAFLFGNQPYDELVIDDVTEAMANMGLNREQMPARAKPSNTVAQYMEVVRRAHIVVATRFHATVLALHAHRAVLGVCYGPKSVELLKDMGQAEFALDLDEFRTEDLKRAFLRLCGSLDAQIGKIRERHAEYQRALDEQYGKVLALLA